MTRKRNKGNKKVNQHNFQRKAGRPRETRTATGTGPKAPEGWPRKSCKWLTELAELSSVLKTLDVKQCEEAQKVVAV